MSPHNFGEFGFLLPFSDSKSKLGLTNQNPVFPSCGGPGNKSCVCKLWPFRWSGPQNGTPDSVFGSQIL